MSERHARFQVSCLAYLKTWPTNKENPALGVRKRSIKPLRFPTSDRKNLSIHVRAIRRIRVSPFFPPLRPLGSWVRPVCPEWFSGLTASRIPSSLPRSLPLLASALAAPVIAPSPPARAGIRADILVVVEYSLGARARRCVCKRTQTGPKLGPNGARTGPKRTP